MTRTDIDEQSLIPSGKKFDAIVVGLGISSGWSAKKLCEKGLNVLLLERGRMIEHVTDMALSERTADYAVRALKRGDIRR